MTFATSMEALTADAAVWDGVAAELADAGRAAGALTLDPAAFSFAGGDVAATYEAVRAQVASLLTSAEAEISGAADTLLKVRDTYRSTDEGAKASLAGVWDVG